jgi:acyl dehydratase
MAEKPLTYDQITTGMVLPEIEFEISEEHVKKYAEAVEDLNPIYFENEQAHQFAYSRKIAPPTIGALFILKIYDGLGGQPDGTIHAKQQFKFLGPIYVGEIIRTSGKVVGKRRKRGRQYVEVQTHSLNQLGELIMVGRSTFIWP